MASKKMQALAEPVSDSTGGHDEEIDTLTHNALAGLLNGLTIALSDADHFSTYFGLSDSADDQPAKKAILSTITYIVSSAVVACSSPVIQTPNSMATTVYLLLELSGQRKGHVFRQHGLVSFQKAVLAESATLYTELVQLSINRNYSLAAKIDEQFRVQASQGISAGQYLNRIRKDIVGICGNGSDVHAVRLMCAALSNYRSIQLLASDEEEYGKTLLKVKKPRKAKAQKVEQDEEELNGDSAQVSQDTKVSGSNKPAKGQGKGRSKGKRRVLLE